MTIALRQLRPDDWEAFRAVRLAALADAPGNFFASLAEAQALPDPWWRTLLTKQRTALFGAFAHEEGSDRLVGITGAFTDRDDPTGRTAAFGMTWLAPGHRGQGIGHRFYQVRLDWARTQGFARVEVSHRGSNEPSRRAMLAAGFRHVATRRHCWPDGAEEDDLLYELRLD
ncbi:GNAT family N-acetyltransferase [Sphingomonas sp.]|uniref:GNAT family N-acetyltransferase n=1 Tax=Sphingomonas sp. TaxID=28214 RepID=UPI003CC5F694